MTSFSEIDNQTLKRAAASIVGGKKKRTKKRKQSKKRKRNLTKRNNKKNTRRSQKRSRYRRGGNPKKARALLEWWRLEKFADAIINEGYDSIELLSKMDDNKLDNLASKISMKRGDKSKLRLLLSQLKEAPEEAAAAVAQVLAEAEGLGLVEEAEEAAGPQERGRLPVFNVAEYGTALAEAEGLGLVEEAEEAAGPQERGRTKLKAKVL